MTETLYLLLALLTVSPGETESLVLDHSLTYEDCQRAKNAGVIFKGPQLRQLQGVILECQEEDA